MNPFLNLNSCHLLFAVAHKITKKCFTNCMADLDIFMNSTNLYNNFIFRSKQGGFIIFLKKSIYFYVTIQKAY